MNGAMNGGWLGSRVLHWLTLPLAEREGEAVLGDVEEEGAGFLASAAGIFGLVVRRELAEWRSPSAWLTMAGVLVPGVFLLAATGERMADTQAIPLWMLVNNCDRELLRQPGFWAGVRDVLPRLLFTGTTLLSWSWCCGYVSGLASRSTRGVNRILICALVGLVLIGWMPAVYDTLAMHEARSSPWNAVVFRTWFYASVFPKVTVVFLVMLPLLRGVSDASRSPERATSTIMACLAMVSFLTAAPRAAAGVSVWFAAVIVGLALFCVVRRNFAVSGLR